MGWSPRAFLSPTRWRQWDFRKFWGFKGLETPLNVGSSGPKTFKTELTGGTRSADIRYGSGQNQDGPEKHPDGSFTVPWFLKNVVLVLAKRTFWVQKSCKKKFIARCFRQPFHHFVVKNVPSSVFLFSAHSFAR